MNMLPSWNDFLSIAQRSGMITGFKHKWIKQGFNAAIQGAKDCGYNILEWDEFELSETGRQIKKRYSKITPLIFTNSIHLVFRIWRPTFARYDVFNPAIKFVIDGFVEAGVMADDSWCEINRWHTEFMGIDDQLKLSPEAKAERKVKRRTTKQRMPVYARYWFDFYLT